MSRLIKLFIQGCPSLGLHNLVGINLSVRLFRAALNKFHFLSAVILQHVEIGINFTSVVL